MLLPTRIEVRNIRSIPHAVIEPLGDGITALTGPIGVGKSTMFNAVLWACYGEVGGIPGALVQSEMRRTGSGDDEPVEATVEFELNGDTYRAVRRLRSRSRGGKKVEVASAELWINGIEQPQITPSKLTEKVETLTGLSGRAYSGAFFCAQNHLPALAEGTPAEVQRIIEDQTGLSSLTGKIDTARSTAKDAQVAADALPGSVEEVESAQGEVDAAQSEGERLWAEFETAKARSAKTRELWEAARAEHQAVASRQRAATQAQVQLAEAEARIEAVTEQIADLDTEAERLPAVNVEQVKRDAATLRDLIATAQRAQHLVGTAADGVADAGASVAVATEAAGGFSGALDTRLAEATSRLTKAQNDMGALHGEYERLTRAIDTIRASGPDTAECPTCTQRLADARVLLVDLIAQRDATTSRGTATRAAVEETEAQVRDLAAQVKARDEALAEQQRATAAAGTAQARLDATRAEAQKTLTSLTRVTGGDPDDDPAGTIEQGQQQLDATAAQVATADRAATVAEQVTARRAALADLNRTREEARTRAHDVVPDDDVVAAETHATDTHATHSVEEAARQKAETEAKVAAERSRSAEAARDRAAATLEKKAEALTKADTLRHAHQILTALRRDLLADYTATISDAASHLMDQVGGGDHIGVVIDATWVPRVVLATGEERPMRVLSGGEKARAALCLRLGIADQITAGSGAGMVFADEITANQDEGTTQDVVDLIRGLGRPMVLIGHAPQIAQIANRVYVCEKSDEATGTSIGFAGVAQAPVPVP
ncbi:MAG: SMC family ATPase [Nocardioides sp.]|nr:SMC family ATPase [Nocardioides sp.]